MCNQGCLASLRTSKTKTRITEVREAHKMTFHWLYDPSVVSFSDWLRNGSDSTGSLYWVQGKPGSGKSTLMKFAMKDSRTLELLGEDSQRQWTFVAFFFHDRGSTIQKSLVGMLQEILYSILKQLPELRPYVITQYKQLVKTQRTRSPTWDLEALQAAINSIIEQRETRIKLLVFLDALDEHEGDNDQLVQILKDWGAKADGYFINLKICLASRSWNVFEHNFGHGPNFAIHSHTKEDIRVYTHLRLQSLLHGSPALLSSESSDALIEQITAKAQGVFIWVRLVMDQLAKDIQDGTPLQILTRKIAELPEELKDLYDHTLSRIEPTYATETHIMLQIVLSSFEPLPLESLINATEYCLNVCVHGGDRYSQSTDIGRWQHLTDDPGSLKPKLRWLTSRGGGVLEAYLTSPVKADADASNHYVQFLHQTAKEYVQSNPSNHLMKRVARPIAEKTGFYFLTLSSQSSSGWVAPIKVHMLHYAKLAEKQGQIDARIDFIDSWKPRDEDSSGPCNFAWWLRCQKDTFPMHFLESIDNALATNGPFWKTEYYHLAIIVAANLLSLIDSRISSLIDSRISSLFREYTRAPDTEICLLQLAIGGPDIVPAKLQDRAEMVRRIISLGYPPDQPVKLWYSVNSSEHRESSGTTKDSRSSDDELVSEDCAQGSIRSVPSVKNGPDIIDHSVPMTPLSFLISGCGITHISEDTRFAVAKTLLESGAKSNERIFLSNPMSPNGKINLSLLSFCAVYRSAAFVRLLFQYGARDNDVDVSGCLAYDHAILRQDKAILAAFEEYEGKPELRLPGVFNGKYVEQQGVASTLVLCNNILASVGHPGLAIIMSRAWESRRNVNSVIRSEEIAAWIS